MPMIQFFQHSVYFIFLDNILQSIKNEEELEVSDNDKKMFEKTYSRRKFLRDSGFAVGGVVAGGLLGGLLINNNEEKVEQEIVHEKANRALMFFNQEQLWTVEAATERIFPKDELGPGAKDLGVAFFIDHQLASPWGYSAREYMQGPFYQGEPTQGYQGRQTNSEVFMIGLRGLQHYAKQQYDDSFENLTGEEQDDILTDFQDLEGESKVSLSGITSNQFFSMLHMLTIEGVYSDPMYGGNDNMEGWKMKKFPGHQVSYMDVIEEKEFVEKTPQSLSSMHK